MSVRQNGAVIAGGGTKDMLTLKNISNCITEIPQDIKLELNNGTLTLKAGSKVYVPNGAGVFDAITIASDLTISSSGSNSGTMYLFVKQDGTVFYSEWNQESGTGTPTGTWTTYYNTADNKVYRYTTSTTTPSYQASFPIGIITVSNGTITSINQVFNGFGYIGSSTFVLPGVKGLSPNGRNADGSLKNIETEITNVRIRSGGGSDQKNIYADVRPAGTLDLNGEFKYDEKNNITYNGVNIEPQFVIAKFDNSGGKITNFAPKTAFHAVDYNDTDFIAHQSMPSGKYIELTLGVSGTRYDAPADGWFYISAKTSGTNYQVIMAAGYMSVSFRSSSLNQRIILPVSKGMVMNLNYDGTLSDTTFRFIYAQGAQ